MQGIIDKMNNRIRANPKSENPVFMPDIKTMVRNIKAGVDPITGATTGAAAPAGQVGTAFSGAVDGMPFTREQ